MDVKATMNMVVWIDMFRRTMHQGVRVKPRGFEIMEIEDHTIRLSPDAPFMAFDARNINVEYFKQEMLWKLTANKYDESIKRHAKMWESVQNPDGTFNSNYGQFWFGEQNGFWHVIQELCRDPDSRRAVIPMLAKEHLSPQTTDTVCTESVGFRIRDGALNMSIHMRSSDQIFGLGTDIPTFALLYRLVLGVLRISKPELEVGVMNITAMSSHIYDRHYLMVGKILHEYNDLGKESFKHISMPYCDGNEAMQIIFGRGKINEACGKLGEWLVS